MALLNANGASNTGQKTRPNVNGEEEKNLSSGFVVPADYKDLARKQL